MFLIRWTFRLIKLFIISCFISGVILSALGGVSAFFLLKHLSEDLPPIAGVTHKPSITTKIYDRNGEVLDELFAEELRGEIVSIEQIPKMTQNAFIAVEDERYRQHYGIDPKRILGALYADIKEKRAVQGASTITQQLARNMFLTSKKTIKRKLQEMIMAFRLERTFTKDEILSLYLNQIFFGGRIHGISSAARYYFGKKVENLNVAESAILAGMVKGPNLYTPFNRHHPDAWKKRQVIVLGQMKKLGYISPSSYESAVNQRMAFASGETHSSSRNAQYFVEHVKKFLLDRFGYKKVYAQGLKVYTTLDLEVQKMAEKTFLESAVFKEKPIEDFPKFQGAFCAVDPKDGSILAMIGGRDFNLYKFNRATQARRQPGSAFKPFVYAAGFEAGLSPNTIINDEPYSKYDAGSGKWWTPKNYGGSYAGPVTIAYALAKSLNVVAVRVAERAGVDKIVAMAQRCGVMSPLTPNLTLALGSSEVTLLEMVSAYGTFANQGIHVQPRAISKVIDAEGQVIFQQDPIEKEALGEDVAYLIAQTMRGTVEWGTGTAAKVDGFQIAGKTGTNQDFIDAWFIGYTPNLAVGCNIGYDDRQSLGRGMTGGKLAAPIAGNFLKAFLKVHPAPSFVAPSSTETLKVCEQSGLKAGGDCTKTRMMTFRRENAPLVVCNAHLYDYSEENMYEGQSGDGHFVDPSYGSEFGGDSNREDGTRPPGSGYELLTEEFLDDGGY